MSSKSFITISQKECQTAYLKILYNSDKLWESSELLAQKENFGMAVSHALMSLEELVKAIIIFADGLGFKFRKIEGVSTFFTNHKLKFMVAYSFLVLSLLLDEIFKIVADIIKKPKETLEKYEMLKSSNVEQKKYFFYIGQIIVKIRKEFKWFNQAERYRQDGFYCDYPEELKIPQTISRDDFLIVNEKLERIRNLGKLLIDSYSSKDDKTLNQIAKIKEYINQYDIYMKIGKLLKKVKAVKDFGSFFTHFE